MAKPALRTTSCDRCGGDMATRLTPAQRSKAVLSCPKPECQAAHAEHIAASAAEASARRSAAATAAHARAGQPVQAWGDWGQLAAFSRKG
jgi:hypothetical protein